MKIQRTPTRRLGKPLVIKGVKDEATLQGAALKHAGRALGNLVRASDQLDTKASTEILDRAVGKTPQQLRVSGTVTLKALHAHVIPQLAAPARVIEPPAKAK